MDAGPRGGKASDRPYVLVLIDDSRSMGAKWSQVQEVWTRIQDSAVWKHCEVDVRRFHASLRPAARSCALALEPMAPDGALIEKATRRATPLAEALNAGLGILCGVQGDSQRRRSIAMVTDGVPACGWPRHRELAELKRAWDRWGQVDWPAFLLVLGRPPPGEARQLRDPSIGGPRFTIVADAPALLAALEATCRAILLPPGRQEQPPVPRPPECPVEPLEDVVAVGGDGGWHCSGVIVAPGSVLTAKHCLPATRVLLGSSIHAPTDVIAVTAARPHPSPSVDAALLTMARDPGVPARPWRKAGDRTPPQAVLRHAGFGARGPMGRAGFGFKHFNDRAGLGWSCEGRQAQELGCDPRHELYLSDSGGRDTCDGDSGGPVYEKTRAELSCPEGRLPDDHLAVWRVIGITSRPAANARQRCGDGGIYERLDAMADWLEAAIHEGNSLTRAAR